MADLNSYLKLMSNINNNNMYNITYQTEIKFIKVIVKVSTLILPPVENI